jgi:predicted Rossmann fold flavoprotein
MAGGTAAKRGLEVLILEKASKPAEKLSITGGGRCNITNATYNVRDMLKNYGSAEQYLFSPFSKFSVKNTFTFFEKNKLPLVIEARNRVFPKTQKASDVVDTLLNFVKKNKVKILSGVGAKKFIFDDTTGQVLGIETADGKYFADEIIMSTGGYAGKNATGDGFKMLKKLGHKIHRPNPNLVPLKSKDK